MVLVPEVEDRGVEAQGDAYLVLRRPCIAQQLPQTLNPKPLFTLLCAGPVSSSSFFSQVQENAARAPGVPNATEYVPARHDCILSAHEGTRECALLEEGD